MFKKLAAAALIASMLVLPVNSVGPVPTEGASSPEQGQDYLPGDVPAETDAAESMSPAFHALVLAMLNHDVTRFSFEDHTLTWEGLYNMLSLYGQLDSRSSSDNGELFLPEETVQDYASALKVDVDALPPLPAELRDRINYDNVSRCYVIFRGEDDQARIQVDDACRAGGVLILTGSLVYEVDGQVLTQFQATLQPQDNMFGYAVTSLSLAG